VSRVGAFVSLVRAPAALTVPGDTLAGAAAAGQRLRGRRLLLPLASVCLYWAGMALNDYADRRVDAVERPERPLPSGRVRPAEAFAVAAGLTGAGVALARLGGGRPAARVAMLLAGAVWAYDLMLKRGPLGPVAMGACRGLDVLLGAGGASDVRAALPAAASLAAHTAGVTALARGEVHGSSARAATLVCGGTALIGASAALGGRRVSPWHRVLAVAGAVGYGAQVGAAQWSAAHDPSAAAVRRATVAGIHGMVPLQAALAARAGAVLGAASVLVALPVARALARAVSPT
jgi:UbiA prenyltransferase family